MDLVDKEVFDEDYRRYFSIHLDIPKGVYGGDLGIQRGGRPCRSETISVNAGKHWQDMIRNKIARQGLSCPSTNRYRDNNRLFQ